MFESGRRNEPSAPGHGAGPAGQLIALSILFTSLDHISAVELPTAVIALIKTTMTSASIMPYSTAVGPSSLLRKAKTRGSIDFIRGLPSSAGAVMVQ